MTSSFSATALRLVALSALLGLSAGCAGEASKSGPDAGGPAAPAEGAPEWLSFEPSATLEVAPLARVTLNIVALPPGRYLLKFATLSGLDGQPTDASLQHDELFSGPDGRAEVELTAASRSGTFRVRASSGSASAERGVAVSASGYATVAVTPSYAGSRPVRVWRLSASTGVTCANAGSDFPGDLLAQALAGSGELTLESVPAEASVALFLQGDDLLAGCLDAPGLRPFETKHLTITALDLPLRLESSLETSLVLERASQGFYSDLSADIEHAIGALDSGANDDVAALLGAMATLAGQEREAFATARGERAWDEAVAELWAPSAPTRLRMQAAQWMAEGVEGLAMPDEAIVGLLGAVSDRPDQALFSLLRVGGADAVRAGFGAASAVSWVTEPGDAVLLGFGLSWYPSQLVTALGEVQARKAFSTVDFRGALSEALLCSALAERLAKPTPAYGQCNEACVAQLCSQAALVLWETARQATVFEQRSLEVRASATAKVEGTPAIETLQGSWLGKVAEVGKGELSVEGALRAVRASP
jgi:hypothetical protein